MISEKQLKDYARKIYEKKPGYSLDKAFKLFSRLAIKISLYLSQFSVEDMRDTIKTLNISFLGMYKFELLQLEKEFIEVGKIISLALKNRDNIDLLNELKKRVIDLTDRF